MFHKCREETGGFLCAMISYGGAFAFRIPHCAFTFPFVICN